MTTGALAGVKVIDLTHHIAGPYATKLLADHGADVLKIERPGGDPGRRLPPFFHDEPHQEKSLPFLYLNTNKRSITLNLKSDEGRGILMDLLADADALAIIEAFLETPFAGGRHRRRVEKIAAIERRHTP